MSWLFVITKLQSSEQNGEYEIHLISLLLKGTLLV